MVTSTVGHYPGYRRFRVYREAELLATEVMRVTDGYPNLEKYGSVSQSRAAALSVASNIAEGYRRCSDREFVRFLKISLGSVGELESQLTVAQRSGWISSEDSQLLSILTSNVSRWLYRLIKSIEGQLRPGPRHR